MKSLFLLFALSTSIFSHVSAQNASEKLLDAFDQLKVQFNRRADIVRYFIIELDKLEKFDKEQLQQTKIPSDSLSIYIESIQGKLDSLTILELRKKIGKQIRALSNILSNTENFPELRASEVFKNLQFHLMGIENRLVTSIRQYNELCTEEKREDLLFKGQWE